MTGQQNYLGKPCYFLFPSDEIQNKLVFELFKQGYEAYIIDTHKKLIKFVLNIQDSIFFICFNKNSQFEWESFFSELSNIYEANNLNINFIIDEEEANLGLLKGINKDNIYKLEPDLKSITESIIKYLEKIEARGRRKFVRANCDALSGMCKSGFNIIVNSKEYHGNINNISIAGMLANFDDKELFLEPNTEIDKIELRLNDFFVSVSGKVLRDEVGFDENLYVILFDREKMDDEEKEIIFNFIFMFLQKYIMEKINNFN